MTGSAPPFLLGFFRPRIYLPSGIPEDACDYVLSHENAHIRRRDHWWKPLGFLLLTVYWFNPLLWVGYILLCRDIERACDEKVVANASNTYKLGYAEALVDCSVHRRLVMACPVAFGEISVKSRVKRVLHYKKPGFWLVLVSVVLCIVTALCFLTNPEDCKHLYFSDVRIQATCTEMGIENRTCIFCKHSYTAPTPALSHSYDEGVVTQEPICVRDGILTISCTRCQDTYKEAIPATGVHTLTETVLHTASCAAAGDGIRSCSHCDYTESCSYEPLYHTWADGIVIPSNREADGSRQIICTVCTAEQWYTIPKTCEHNWVQIDTTNYWQCLNCKNTEQRFTSYIPRFATSASSTSKSVTNSYSGVYSSPSTTANQPIVWDPNGTSSAGYQSAIRIFP